MKILPFISLSFLVILTSCTAILPPSTTPQAPTLSWKAREIALNRLQQWQLTGKIGVQTAHQAGSANFDWKQELDAYQLTLSGPLGTNQVQLMGNKTNSQLTLANGQHYSASSPEQLLRKQWGYQVPVTYLRYWIRGIPAPHQPAQTQFDTQGRVSTLKQGNWLVTFSSYTQIGGLALPDRLLISSSQLKAKLVIHRWSI